MGLLETLSKIEEEPVESNIGPMCRVIDMNAFRNKRLNSDAVEARREHNERVLIRYKIEQKWRDDKGLA
jgi:kynurenine formamidase